MTKSSSTDEQDYEVLIRRRGENDYASYCPQLGIMIKGSEHTEVEEAMQQRVREHITELKATQ
jgi:glutamate-1-semialdehyde aminotransferase